MPATLTKITDGKAVVYDDLRNEQTVKRPRREQTYRLGYSDTEWHRVKNWLKLTQTAIRKDHDQRHEAATIPLEWRGIRRRCVENDELIALQHVVRHLKLTVRIEHFLREEIAVFTVQIADGTGGFRQYVERWL